jgi:hypothetical protein
MTVTVGGHDCELGIDVAVYQPAIDWPGVETANRLFTVNKASGGDGALYKDPTFDAHHANAAGHVHRSAYHFLGMGGGASQADALIRATNGLKDLDLPPLVDYETYGNHGQYRPSTNDLADFLRELHTQTDHRWPGPQGTDVAAMVYTFSSMPTYAELAEFDLFLAAYLNPYYGNPWQGVTNTATPNVALLGTPDHYVPRPWTTWSGWQFAGGDGGCPGVGNGVNNCDQDVIKADVLARLLGGAPNTGDGFLATTDSMATTAIWAADQVMERLAYGQDQVSRDAREAIARSDLFHGSGWARIQAEQSGVPAGEGNNQPYPDMARILDAVGALAAEVADLKAKLVHA